MAPAPAESLRDVLLRDTLSRATENDQTTFQIVLNNLQTFVEVVHHQGYSSDLMTCQYRCIRRTVATVLMFCQLSGSNLLP